MIDNISQIDKLRSLDKAFLNSILSYSVYTERQWTIDYSNNDIKNDSSVQKSFLQQAGIEEGKKIDLKKSYEIFVSLFNKETFHDVELELEPTKDFSFKNNNYTAKKNLSKATVVKSKNEDGTYSLHLSFRGTDKKARKMFFYLTQAYVDMEEYYQSFKPLEEAVLKYAEDPKNNISDIQISGHSLGGAMVQAFFNSPNVKQSKIKMEGFTFGAPGSKKNVIEQVSKKMTEAINGLTNITFGAKLFQITNDKPINDKIFQFKHSGDLVPKIGSLAYETSGTEIILKDNSLNDRQEQLILNEKNINSNIFFSKTPGRDRMTVMKNMINSHKKGMIENAITFLKNRFLFKHHDMLRYSFNIEDHAKDYIYQNGFTYQTEILRKETPHLEKFHKFKKAFSWSVSSHQATDMFSMRYLDNKRAQYTKDGNVIYRLPKKVQENISKLRESSFDSKMRNIAINGLNP